MVRTTYHRRKMLMMMIIHRFARSPACPHCCRVVSQLSSVSTSTGLASTLFFSDRTEVSFFGSYAFFRGLARGTCPGMKSRVAICPSDCSIRT